MGAGGTALRLQPQVQQTGQRRVPHALGAYFSEAVPAGPLGRLKKKSSGQRSMSLFTSSSNPNTHLSALQIQGTSALLLICLPSVIFVVAPALCFCPLQVSTEPPRQCNLLWIYVKIGTWDTKREGLDIFFLLFLFRSLATLRFQIHRPSINIISVLFFVFFVFFFTVKMV